MKRRKHFGIKLILAAAVVIFVAANVPEMSSSAVTLLRKVIPGRYQSRMCRQEAVSSNPQRYEEHMGGCRGWKNSPKRRTGKMTRSKALLSLLCVRHAWGRERKVYDEIYQAIDSHASKVRSIRWIRRYSSMPTARDADHGEIFWFRDMFIHAIPWEFRPWVWILHRSIP